MKNWFKQTWICFKVYSMVGIGTIPISIGALLLDGDSNKSDINPLWLGAAVVHGFLIGYL